MNNRENKMNIIGIHVFGGRVSTLEGMVRHILNQLVKETKGQAWFDDIAQFFKKYIREVGLFGISVSFAPPEQDLKELVRNFPEIIGNLLEKIKRQNAGLFIALDDINGLAEKEEFANWYKSFVDEVAAEKIGQKYLDPKVYRAIRSEPYRSILRKLGEEEISSNFKKKDVEAKLSENKK
jgi:hypothetical protein